jgi:hypothetical protein
MKFRLICLIVIIQQTVSEKNTFINVFEADPQMLLTLGTRHGDTRRNRLYPVCTVYAVPAIYIAALKMFVGSAFMFQSILLFSPNFYF